MSLAKHIDLADYVSVKGSACLNADKKTSVAGILGPDDGLLLSDEDTDEQLLLTIPFTEAVKLHSIRFAASEPGADNADGNRSGPKSIKLFVGKPNLDFSDADDEPATQSIELTDKHLAGAEFELKFVKFQQVRVITVFVSTNQDDSDVTFLNRLSFTGSPILGTNMSELKKAG